MEQFKKWKDNKCVKVCNLCHIGVCGSCSRIGTKEDTWRAALELVLEWLNHSSEHKEIKDKIHDELESD